MKSENCIFHVLTLRRYVIPEVPKLSLEYLSESKGEELSSFMDENNPSTDKEV